MKGMIALKSKLKEKNIVLTDNEVVLKRTEASAEDTIRSLKNVPDQRLLTDIFVRTNDPIAKQLLRKYEMQLLAAKLEPQKFKENLHKFFIDTTKYIVENNLYKKFFEFSNYIYITLLSKSADENIVKAYQNLIYQHYCYFTKPSSIVYGINSKNELMITSELYPKLEYAMLEFEKKYTTKQKGGLLEIQKLYKKYGYEINHPDDLEKLYRDDQLATNMMIQMSYYIDETTADIMEKPYYLASGGYSGLNPQWKDTEFYKNQLQNRNFIIPTNGVVSVIKNSPIKEILFKERYVDGKIIMLYRATFYNDTHTSGFYDIEANVFYSAWRDSDGYTLFHLPFENFILEIYAFLTTDVDVDRKRIYAAKVVDNIDNPGHFYETQPVVQFVLPENNTSAKKTETKRLPFDRNKYKTDEKHINPFIRRLPEGYKASDDAVERARKLGYILREGETFVRPFDKGIRTLK